MGPRTKLKKHWILKKNIQKASKGPHQNGPLYAKKGLPPGNRCLTHMHKSVARERGPLIGTPSVFTLPWVFGPSASTLGNWGGGRAGGNRGGGAGTSCPSPFTVHPNSLPKKKRPPARTRARPSPTRLVVGAEVEGEGHGLRVDRRECHPDPPPGPRGRVGGGT